MSIPNILSVFRIFLVGAFVYCHAVNMHELAFFVVLVSGLSDLLDGYIARKFNQITDLGKVLDPIADKLFSVTTVVCLCLEEVIGWWLLLVMVARELFTLVGAVVFYKKTQGVIASAWYGKVSTVLFFGGFLVALISLCSWGTGAREGLQIAAYILLIVAVALSVFSAVQYTLSAVKLNRAYLESRNGSGSVTK